MTSARRLPASVAFYLEASIIVVFLAASIAPSPLYAVYQAQWGFTSSTITVIFGIYAFAVLATLLTAGSLSDHIGRRPVLLGALAIQAAALVLLATADGLSGLVAGRLLQGVAMGLAAGAVGAGMLDIDWTKGTLANSVAPITGSAAGALVSGLLVEYLPAPTHLVYLVLLGVVFMQAAGVALMDETAQMRPGAIASLRPRFELPAAIRGPLLIALPALVASWALGGFYGSLGPSLVRDVSHSSSLALGGIGLFVIGATGAVSVLVLRNIASSLLALIGTAALIVGVGITLAALPVHSELWFFIGTAVSGVGFAGGFQGAIRTVLPLAAPEHRAGVLSVIYVVSYLALGLPAIGAGVLVVHSGSLEGTTRSYGIAVIALAAAAFLGLAQRARVASRLARETDPCVQPCIG